MRKDVFVMVIGAFTASVWSAAYLDWYLALVFWLLGVLILVAGFKDGGVK